MSILKFEVQIKKMVNWRVCNVTKWIKNCETVLKDRKIVSKTYG